jgi:hypothetical protein
MRPKKDRTNLTFCEIQPVEYPEIAPDPEIADETNIFPFDVCRGADQLELVDLLKMS